MAGRRKKVIILTMLSAVLGAAGVATAQYPLGSDPSPSPRASGCTATFANDAELNQQRQDVRERLRVERATLRNLQRLMRRFEQRGRVQMSDSVLGFVGTMRDLQGDIAQQQDTIRDLENTQQMLSRCTLADATPGGTYTEVPGNHCMEGPMVGDAQAFEQLGVRIQIRNGRSIRILPTTRVLCLASEIRGYYDDNVGRNYDGGVAQVSTVNECGYNSCALTIREEHRGRATGLTPGRDFNVTGPITFTTRSYSRPNRDSYTSELHYVYREINVPIDGDPTFSSLICRYQPEDIVYPRPDWAHQTARDRGLCVRAGLIAARFSSGRSRGSVRFVTEGPIRRASYSPEDVYRGPGRRGRGSEERSAPAE